LLAAKWKENLLGKAASVFTPTLNFAEFIYGSSNSTKDNDSDDDESDFFKVKRDKEAPVDSVDSSKFVYNGANSLNLEEVNK
jgi:hypothetical protein